MAVSAECTEVAEFYQLPAMNYASSYQPFAHYYIRQEQEAQIFFYWLFIWALKLIKAAIRYSLIRYC